MPNRARSDRGQRNEVRATVHAVQLTFADETQLLVEAPRTANDVTGFIEAAAQAGWAT